jgi:hypothetical protein
MDEPYANQLPDHDRLLACATLRQNVQLVLMLRMGKPR